jgi:hypothetical protein
VKKFLNRLFVFLLVFIVAFSLFTDSIEAAKDDLKASIGVYQESSDSETGKCYGPYFTPKKKLKVEIYNIRYKDYPIVTKQDVIDAGATGAKKVDVVAKLVGAFSIRLYIKLDKVENGVLDLGEIDISRFWDRLGPNETISKKVRVKAKTVGDQKEIFDKNITVVLKREVDEENCFTEPSENSFDLCLQIPDNQSEARDRCMECFEEGGVWTAVGCIPQTSEGIISTIMEIGLIIAGAIVLIMILVGAFMLSTSQGDPKKTQEAKELITSAIIGLLFIVFSVTILQFIGVSIIRIPGFGEL